MILDVEVSSLSTGKTAKCPESRDFSMGIFNGETPFEVLI
jgi:hypothetical protein